MRDRIDARPVTKTVAGKERSEIAQVEYQIGEEKTRIRLMQAEVAHLEQPARIEALATNYLDMQPVQAKQETTPM